MVQPQKVALQENNDLKKLFELFKRNIKTILVCIIIAVGIAFLVNHYITPLYKVSASILIKEDQSSRNTNMNDFLNSNIFGRNQNFENELWVLKSSPVIEQTIRNLDLTIHYFKKSGFNKIDTYKEMPFKVWLMQDHVQPVNVFFYITIQDDANFFISAKSKKAIFKKLDKNEYFGEQKKWNYEMSGKFGELIETPEMAFIIQLDSAKLKYLDSEQKYGFNFNDLPSMTDRYKKKVQYKIIDKNATVVEIALKSASLSKGKDVVNGIMDVYSQQNLEQKNHIANITIDYIDKQLSEISESLNQAEDNLQSFRASNQLLNVTEQATGIYEQYIDLQNQLAELVTRKRYYDYVADYISKNNDFSNMIVPASMGIQDQLLNNLMSELIAAQAQRTNLIQNRQEKNPLVQKLEIQIENTRSTISENISAVRKTTEISIDEMNKRVRKIESQINRLPGTQRQLGGIERKYRLNDAIYNYLLEKRAEAKITQASNMPDNIIIEPAKMEGIRPVFPNKKMNYIVALFLGLFLPVGFILIRSALNNKIESQEDLELLSDIPVTGKILHNRRKTNNVVFDHPKSNITESFRTLRTNLEIQYRNLRKKVILVTSSIEGEGKSFTAKNLAMSYAQLGRRTLLLDFDLRKPSDYFTARDGSHAGISSFLTGTAVLDEIVLHSKNEKLDYIPSGPIPPNPIELLDQSNLQAMIEGFKNNYECIILDTTPLAQVSDAYLLLDFADIKIIVARYNSTLKRVFSLIIKDLKKKNVDNLCAVLNDNRYFQDQYGYGYGYNKKE